MPFKTEEKIIFIHIPKTGGTSIEEVFEINHPENFCFYRWGIDQFEFIEKHKHLTNSEKINFEPQHYTIDLLKELIEDYNSYFKFTFVRNPYTKLLSEYYWLKNQILNDYSKFNSADFHSWCSEFLANINSSHKEPQINYIDETVNFIGKYENFSNDFEILVKHLINSSSEFTKYQNKAIPLLNTTGLNKSILIPSILQETKELIYKTYTLDFIKFNYDSQL